MRIVSFAPMTWPEALVPAMVNSGKAALAAAAPCKSLRRDKVDMLDLQSMAGEKTRATTCRITTQPLDDVQQSQPDCTARVVPCRQQPAELEQQGAPVYNRDDSDCFQPDNQL